MVVRIPPSYPRITMPHHDALTTQGFDGTRLTRLLLHQIQREPHRRVRFRNAANGQDILAVPSNGNGNGVTAHPDLQRLAAHCRGNPGTALTYWRESLRTEPDDACVQAADGEERNDDIVDEEDVWVTNQLHDPILPNETGEDVALVLHALLLHNGLATRWVAELLPLARDVSLSLDDPSRISIQNHLRVTIERIDSPHDNRVVVACRTADQQLLLAEVMPRSIKELDLAPGQQVYALIKSAALME